MEHDVKNRGNRKINSPLLFFVFFFLFCGPILLSITSVDAAGISKIGKDELNADLSNPDIIILDVRAPMNWLFSTSKIKGAIREDPRDVKAWESKYPKDKKLVLYCQTDVTSSGVAREMASAGFERLYVLKGGWSEWSSSNLPTEKK
jgi:rhodanese-related sulfurtransferase